MTGIAFSPDGFLAVTSSSDRTARVWKVDTGDAIAVLAGHGDSVSEATFSPDGKSVLTASDDGTARLWDPEAQPRLAVLVREAVAVTRAAYVGDDVVLVAGEDGARLVRVPGGATVRTLVTRPVSAAAVGADGVIALASGRRVTLYPRGRSAAKMLRQPSAVTAVAFSPDGDRLVTAGADGVARVSTLDGN